MQKIGIFGGTFNPPHIGHQRLVLAAAGRLGLDEVLIMPACIPPHKQPTQLACARDRVNMCTLGLCPDSRFKVSTLEIDRGEKSYTVETLEQLSTQYRSAEFYLIIGSDMLESFTRWYRWQDILALARVCAAQRENGAGCVLSEELTPGQRKRITVIPFEPLEISSSEIRRRIISGESTAGLLESDVRDYIDKNRLYDTRLAPYRELLGKMLSEKRFYHSECVSRAAGELALRFGADENKAVLAGLVHDITKNIPENEQRSFIAEAGIVLSDIEQANTKLLHAVSGEAFLRTQTDIADEEIFSAVRCHTTGKAHMSLLEQVVYIADFISQDRDYPDVDTVRTLAEKSLESAILYTAGYTIGKLASGNKVIHPATVECYNEILLNMKRKGK